MMDLWQTRMKTLRRVVGDDGQAVWIDPVAVQAIAPAPGAAAPVADILLDAGTVTVRADIDSVARQLFPKQDEVAS